MTVYISGPITGIPDNNQAAFYAAEEMLTAVLPEQFSEEAEIKIFNPLKIKTALDALTLDQPVPPTWEDYMRGDIAALCTSTHIVYLPGSENSKGSMLERQIAEALGIKEIQRFIDRGGSS